ncbi:MAG: right-handed parallel beta-helix repeat-containing protein [Actinomycetota bacterium]
MKRIILVTGVALAMLAPTFAKAGIPGFETGSCVYPSNLPLPGSSGTVIDTSNYPSIQAAVDAAHPGDTVLIAAGQYNNLNQPSGRLGQGQSLGSMVLVQTPGLRIRGASHSGTVLDGTHYSAPNTPVLDGDGLPKSSYDVGIEVEADDVLVENLTAHNFLYHGIHWFNVKGYWGRYLTAYDEGDYGIFAFGSRCGEFSDSYTSGNPDSGFYIGECFPCDAVVHHIDAEQNALGYSGTNAGGNLVLRDSIWSHNGIGISPSSLDSEARPPERGLEIKNNIVDENNQQDAPGLGIQSSFWGLGIVLPGVNSNIVAGNHVVDNAVAGVVISPLPSDNNVYLASGNAVWGNLVTHDATLYPNSFDLAQGASSGPDNCWADNTYGTSAPPAPILTTVWGCDANVGTWVTPPGGDPRVEAKLVLDVAGAPAPVGDERAVRPWQTWPAPSCTVATVAGRNVGPCIDAPSGAITTWLPALGLDA